MYRLVPALVREMGQAYPELVRAESADRPKRCGWRRPVSARRWSAASACSTRRPQFAEEGRHARRRHRVQALRHLWLPARSDPGCAARARHRRRLGGVQRCDGTAAREARERRGPAPAMPPPRTSGFALREKLGATEFLGYDTESAEGVVAALVQRRHGSREPDGRRRAARSCSTRRRSTRESGGQVGDTGMMTGEGVRFRVTDTQKKPGDLFVHLGTVEQGTLKAGAALAARSRSWQRAHAIRANHSATHLLHEALRQVLGDHVAQKGSLVAPDRLRFDFSHPKPITAEELARSRGHRQRVRAAERRGHHAPDGGR